MQSRPSAAEPGALVCPSPRLSYDLRISTVSGDGSVFTTEFGSVAMTGVDPKRSARLVSCLSRLSSADSTQPTARHWAPTIYMFVTASDIRPSQLDRGLFEKTIGLSIAATSCWMKHKNCPEQPLYKYVCIHHADMF